MKKLTSVIIAACIAATAAGQDAGSSDRKFRFGLRITPQPMWLASSDKNNMPAGSVFGFGFGLNVEYKFAGVAALLTGIGGDFEGGKYTVRNEPGVYQVHYILDEAGEFVVPSATLRKGQTLYHLKERKVNATFATIPVILKLSTNEYGGFKYFGMFGGELGIRLKTTADDSYYNSYLQDTILTTMAPSTQEDINIAEEAGTIPLRLGMNAGAGAEYRLGGSTSLFFSINFFRSFTNLLEKDSEFTFYKVEAGGYKFVRNSLKLTGIRINLGIMF